MSGCGCNNNTDAQKGGRRRKSRGGYSIGQYGNQSMSNGYGNQSGTMSNGYGNQSGTISNGYGNQSGTMSPGMMQNTPYGQINNNSMINGRIEGKINGFVNNLPVKDGDINAQLINGKIADGIIKESSMFGIFGGKRRKHRKLRGGQYDSSGNPVTSAIGSAIGSAGQEAAGAASGLFGTITNALGKGVYAVKGKVEEGVTAASNALGPGSDNSSPVGGGRRRRRRTVKLSMGRGRGRGKTRSLTGGKSRSKSRRRSKSRTKSRRGGKRD